MLVGLELSDILYNMTKFNKLAEEGLIIAKTRRDIVSYTVTRFFTDWEDQKFCTTLDDKHRSTYEFYFYLNEDRIKKIKELKLKI